jgi:hypothetical protein
MGYFNNFPKVDYDIKGNGITQEVTNITSYVKVSSKMLDSIAFYSFYIIPDDDRPDNVSYNLYGTDAYYWTFFVVNPHLKNTYYDWPQSIKSLQSHTEGKYSGLGAVVDGDVHGKYFLGEYIVGSISGAIGQVIGIYPTTEWVQIKEVSGTFLSSGEGLKGITGEAVIIAKSIKSAALAPRHFLDLSTGLVTDKRTAGVKPVSFFEWEQAQNLVKTKIRIIKPEFIEEVSDRFIAELKLT